jgi:hypothetical protein
MEGDRSGATQGVLSSLVIALASGGVALSLLSPTRAWAGPLSSGETVRSGADGYTTWGNTPLDGPAGQISTGDRQDEPSDGLGVVCHADGMGGCVVPLCGDPLSSGTCRMPTVTITVTAYRTGTAAVPGVIPLDAGLERAGVIDQPGTGRAMARGIHAHAAGSRQRSFRRETKAP